MTKFLLAFIAYSILAQAGLVSARLLVLTTGPDGCSDRKVKALGTALGEVTQMANAAITALANPEVVKSQAFLDFLGQGNDPKAISTGKFQAVKTAVAGGVTELAFLAGAGPKDVVFICPPDKLELASGKPDNPQAAESKETCGSFFFALARNGPPNIVRVCPNFFDARTIPLSTGGTKDIAPNSLATAAKLHTTGGKIGGCPSLTLIHEFQHLKAIVGENIADDLESQVDPISGPPPPPAPGTKAPKVKNPAYTVDQCKGLPPASKIKNAQNFAWFAFDVFADKTRGLPCGTPPASPVASGSKSPKTPTKPLVRRAKTAKPKVAAPAPAKKAPVVAAPKKVATPAAPKKVAAPVAAKPNPLGGGTAPSGPRLARPARLSSTAPRPAATKPAAAAGAKVGAGAKTTSSVKKPVATGKAAPAAPACKVIRRAILQPISTDGEFVR
jgi:hypothetical protein